MAATPNSVALIVRSSVAVTASPAAAPLSAIDTAPQPTSAVALPVDNWQIIRLLKEEGTCRWYDLVGGMGDPGVRHFKAGIVKGCGMEVQMADCDVGDNAISRLCVGLGARLRSGYRSARRLVGV